MAVLPSCSLCRIPNLIRTKLENNKKQFLIYSIFIVLVIEWFSFAYIKISEPSPNPTKYFDFYTMKLYPMLSQLALFVVFFSLFLWKERLHFCFRKSATTFYLSMYYLFNFFAVLFCFSASFYYELIMLTTLGIATFIFLVSFLKQLD